MSYLKELGFFVPGGVYAPTVAAAAAADEVKPLPYPGSGLPQPSSIDWSRPQEYNEDRSADIAAGAARAAAKAKVKAAKAGSAFPVIPVVLLGAGSIVLIMVLLRKR
jgi:hypothetical protein